MHLARTHAAAVLDRILEQPALVQAVRALEPEALHALIRHVGLEDCGELVALASREQLEEVFDADLWHDAASGSRFDARRFALWLELLVEQGVRLAADKLCELDEDLLVMALSKLVFVVDVDSLAVRLENRRDDARDRLEKQLESAPHHELERYLVVARDARAFESVMTVLLELDQRDYDTLARLLHRLCMIATDDVEEHDVLSSEQSAEEDAAQEREQRRERIGYVPGPSAVAFLKQARDTPLAQLIAEEVDAITRMHLRSYEPRVRTSPPDDNLLRMLREARVVAPLRLPRAESALRATLDDARMQQLAYLANVLLSANGLRPVEAAERALSYCERGATVLSVDTDLIKLFRIGFHLDSHRRQHA